MPALIAHYLFGEEALNRGGDARIDAVQTGSEPARKAFLLGCQGPDPFFFCFTSVRRSAAHLGGEMHRRRVGEAFDLLRAGVDELGPEARPAGEAFALGLVAHYVLDRTAHPFVYAQEFELCGRGGEAGDGAEDDDAESGAAGGAMTADWRDGLADARSEVHAVIESEIDCGMLAHYRGCSVAQFPPVGVLEKPEGGLLPAGTLMAKVGRTLFGLDVRPDDYEGAVDDMRLCYSLIEPHGSPRSRRIANLERAVRHHSLLESLAHRADRPEADARSMNEARAAWTNPFTGAVSRESFPDLFERALGDYPRAVAAFLGDGPFDAFARSLDYSGRPSGADR